MIATVTGDFTILILQKDSFKVCVMSFDFYSNHFKVYIYLPCINKQRRQIAPFDINTIISSRDCQTKGLYQGSDDRCEGDCSSDIIRLLHPSQKIHYCNQSVLAIFPDLNIFVFSITIFDLISRSALVRLCLLRASYLYNLTGNNVLQFCFVTILVSL